MPPGTRRANRAGYADHDDFEGLPVRQWRREWVNIAPTTEQETQQVNDVWAIELIHGMPKDYNLLSPHSQELLRAARSGRLYKRPAPTDEEENEVDINANEKTEKKEEEPAPRGFSIKVWKQVPRNVEAPDISPLAKRRKNTVTIASKTVEEKAQGSTVTRATVRRLDAAGNPYTEEITLTDGQAVDGEIISTRVETVHAPAPSLMQVQAARRRPPPPKRKTKAGPGRGKKKNRGGISGGPVHTIVRNGPGVAMPSQAASTTENGASAETNGANKQNGELGDGDDDDDDDGDDGDDDDDDEDRGDSDQPDTSMVDTTIGDASIADNSLVEDAKDADETMSDAPAAPVEAKETAVDVVAAEKLPTNPMALAPTLSSLATGSPKMEGSPLKNVVLPSPTEVRAPSTIGVLEAPKDLDQPMGVETAGSTVAEPPSTVVGEEPEAATGRDLELAPTPSATLLPPPPEQVGNIATPGADDASERVSGSEEKNKEECGPGGIAATDGDAAAGAATGADRLLHPMDLMGEDSIKPEDSASARFPLTESGAPSEVGTGSADETREVVSALKSGTAESEAASALAVVEEAAPGVEPVEGGGDVAETIEKESVKMAKEDFDEMAKEEMVMAKEEPVETAKEEPVETAKEEPVETAKEEPAEVTKEESPAEVTKEESAEATKKEEAAETRTPEERRASHSTETRAVEPKGEEEEATGGVDAGDGDSAASPAAAPMADTGVEVGVETGRETRTEEAKPVGGGTDDAVVEDVRMEEGKGGDVVEEEKGVAAETKTEGGNAEKDGGEEMLAVVDREMDVTARREGETG